MASTNHTTYFDLSQYTANDKPTYLVDYNGDMSKIDAGLHEADSDAKTAISEIGDLANLTTSAKNTIVASINEVDAEADSNTSAIGNLSNLTTTATSDLVSAINEVDGEADNNTSHIGVMANLETAVKTNLVGAVNEVNGKIDNFKLTDIDTCTITISGGSDGGSEIKCAKNSDGSLFKLYGMVVDTHQQWVSSLKYTFTNTGLPAVDTEYTINGAGSALVYTQDSAYNTQYLNFKPLSLKYKTNGDIEVDLGSTGYTTVTRAIFNACLYFNANFGDTPSE